MRITIIRVLSLAILLSCSYSLDLSAQPPERTWVRRFDVVELNDKLSDVYATSDGGFAACGIGTEEVLHNGVWLVKTDQNGLLHWQRRYFRGVNNETDWGISLIQLDDDGFAVGGQFAQAGGGNTLKFGVLRTDSEGNLDWMRTYGNEEIFADACFALIETKGGNILAAGRQSWDQGLTGYAVLISGDGDVIWERYYPGTPEIFAIREVENEGYVMAGHWNIMKIDQNGEIIWQRRYNQCHFKDMVSCGGEGFALVYTTGYFDHSMIDTAIVLTRVDNEGEMLWEARHLFDRNENYPSFQHYIKLARFNDGGFIISAQLVEAANPRRNYSYLLRTDQNGNVMWERVDRNCPDPGSNEGYTSVVVHRDGAPATVGWAVTENRGYDGVLVRFVPEHSAPFFDSHSPESLDTSILAGERIRFAVTALDWQNDVISYRWMINDENAGDSRTLSHRFQEIGDYSVQCWISDDEGSDSIRWDVHAKDLFIVSYSPDTLDLTIRRGSSVDFSLDTLRLTEGEPPEYLWTKIDLDFQQPNEEIHGDSNATFQFLRLGSYAVEGLVYRGESSDAVNWNVAVRGAIWAYVPENLAFEVVPDSVVHFAVEPTVPDAEGQTIRWLVDGEVFAEDTTMFEWNSGQVGNLSYQISVIVADTVEADTVTWEVTVREPDFVDEAEAGSPGRPALLSVQPNPFNSTVMLRFGLDKSVPTRLSIHDISGREVARLVDSGSSVNPLRLTARNAADHRGSAEEQSVIWDASAFAAGIYLARLEAGTELSTVKMMLVR